MICHTDYAERVVASFSHQIQSEYYIRNRSVSIEVIELARCSALPEIVINSSTTSCPCHALFHSFLSDYSKQDASTTASHSKSLIELLKEGKLLTSSLSAIWENTGVCEE